MDLNNKVAIITGSAQGIGKAFAARLLEVINSLYHIYFLLKRPIETRLESEYVSLMSILKREKLHCRNSDRDLDKTRFTLLPVMLLVMNNSRIYLTKQRSSSKLTVLTSLQIMLESILTMDGRNVWILT